MTVIVDGTNGVSTPFVTSAGSVGYTSGQTYAGTIAQSTAVASTSGTTITFTGIPSWAKRITVMFYAVSTSGTSGYKILIGPSGGVESTGYLGASDSQSGASATNPTTSFLITPTTEVSAATIIHGRTEIVNFSGNTWVCVSQTGRSDAAGTATSYYYSGSKPLAGVLTQVQISTANGTDTFDAGSINIIYE